MASHPTMRRKLWRDIGRTWPLFTALVVTVMLGTALYAAADNSYRNLQSSYDNAFAAERFADLFVTGGDVAGFAAQSGQRPDVEAARTRVQADLPMEVPDGSGSSDRLLGRVVGYPVDGQPSVAALTSLTGAANPAPGTVLVEKHMAGEFDLKEGDTLTLATAVGEVQVAVAGTVSSAKPCSDFYSPREISKDRHSTPQVHRQCQPYRAAGRRQTLRVAG